MSSSSMGDRLKLVSDYLRSQVDYLEWLDEQPEYLELPVEIQTKVQVLNNRLRSDLEYWMGR